MVRRLYKNKDIELLVELGRLAERYGADSFSRLAQLIRDPSQADELATVLNCAAERAHRSKPVHKSVSRGPSRVGISVLNELRLADPEKHSILAEIRQRLVAGSILPTMSDIRRFTLTHGLSIGNASSRNAAITPLLRSMSRLPTPSLVLILDELVEYKPDDRSLERWRDVIVRPHS